MKDQWCNLCAAHGLKKKLQYCQVNFEEGILLCENTMCVYPFDSTTAETLKVTKPPNETSEGKQDEPTRNKEQIVNEQVLTNVQQSRLYWCNTDSLCWLDSVLAVLVNNKCLHLCLEKLHAKESILGVLCSKFSDAQDVECVKEGSVLLNKARDTVFEFLKSKMQCQLGVNDCSLTALSLLLKENAYIHEKFIQEYCWRFTCAACGYVQVNRYKKSVISFPNTTEEFTMPSGYFLRPCYKCNEPGQRCTLQFQQLPPCVIVHFVEGVSNKDIWTSQFNYHGKGYQLSQIIQYKRDPDHFVSWVRCENGSDWAEIDDMKSEVHTWKEGTPRLPMKQIHIALWTRSSLYGKSSSITDKNMTIGHSEREKSSTNTASMTRDLSLAQASSVECENTASLYGNGSLASDKNVTSVHGEREKSSANTAVTSTTRVFRDLSLSQADSVECKYNTSLDNDSTLTNIPRECREESNTSWGNVSMITKKCVSGKRKDLGAFQPYIPRKKRTISSENEQIGPENCSFNQSNSDQASLEDVQRRTFLPWQDAVSLDKQRKYGTSDNQSDSGYSSPASNSSCLSLTTPSVKEEEVCLTDLFESPDFTDNDTSFSLANHAVSCDTLDTTLGGLLDEILQTDHAESTEVMTNKIFSNTTKVDILARLQDPLDSVDLAWLNDSNNIDDGFLDFLH